MKKDFNRWALVWYFSGYGKMKQDPIFCKIAELIDSDQRPVVSPDDEKVIEHIIKNSEEYPAREKMCIRIVEICRNNYIDDDHTARLVAALMLDTSVRDRKWERQHNKSSGRILHINGATGEQKIY